MNQVQKLLLGFCLVGGFLSHGPVYSQEVPAPYRIAQEKFQKGNYFEVIRELDQLLEIKPEYAPAYFLQGMAEFKLENTMGALQKFNQAIYYKPDYLEAYYNRGLINLGIDQRNGALADFTYVLERRKVPQVFFVRGKTYYELGQLKSAQADLLQSIAMDTSNLDAYYYLALIDEENDQGQRALYSLDKALHMNPGFENGLQLRARLLMQMNEFDASLQDYSSLIKLNPYNWEAHLHKGIILYQVGRGEEALPFLDRVIEKEWNQTQARTYRGLIYQAEGEKEKACEDWSKAGENGSEEAKRYLEKYCAN